MWIKDKDGDLVNLSQMETIFLRDGDVVSRSVSGATCLFQGTTAECKEYIAALYDKMAVNGITP